MTDPSTRFREHRRRLGFTQRELAEALGTTERQVRRYEHGEAAIPGPITILMQRLINEANHVHDWRCLSCGASGGIPTTSAPRPPRLAPSPTGRPRT